MNYAWYIDLLPGHEFIEKVVEDYQSHTKGCSIFMGKLLDLFKEHDSTQKRELVEVWVKGEAVRAPKTETAKAFQEILAQSLIVAARKKQTSLPFSYRMHQPPGKKWSVYLNSYNR